MRKNYRRLKGHKSLKVGSWALSRFFADLLGLAPVRRARRAVRGSE